MPHETQNIDTTSTQFGSGSGSINLLVFKVSWELTPVGIKITTHINLGPIQDTNTAVLSFHNPSAEFSFGVIGFSAGLGIAFNDARGDLELSAKACSPWGCEKSTTSIHILPENAFGLISQGVAQEGINFVTAHFPHAGLAHGHLQEYTRLAGEVCREMDMESSELAEFMTNDHFLELNKGVTANITTWDQQSLSEIKNINGRDWTIILATLVTDERIQEIFPGIDKKFEFPTEIRTLFESQFKAVESMKASSGAISKDDRDKVLEVVVAVCSAIAVIAGLTASANAVLAGVCLVILGIAAGLAGTAALAVGVLALIGAVILVVLTLVAVGGGIAAAIAALVFGIWWIFSDKSIGAHEPYGGFRQYIAA